MKGIYKIFLAASLMVGVSSCNLDLTPQQSLPVEDVVNNETGLTALMNGAYDRMQAVEYYGRDFVMFVDIAGVSVKNAGTSGRFVPEYNYTRTALDGYPQGFWLYAYRTIANTNHVINNVDKVAMAETTKNSLKGQALFLRALAHFDLVRMFAQPYTLDGGASLGVPYMTDPNAQGAMRPSRNTVKEVYEKAIADLVQAEALLPAKPSSRALASQPAAQALLSRIYLYMADWANSAKYADLVLANGNIKLTEANAYLDYFNGTEAAETIFEIQSQSDENLGANNFAYMYHQDGYGDFRITSDLMKKYQAGDLRLSFFEEVGDRGMMTTKYDKMAGMAVGQVSPKVIRLAEVILNKAEALANQGNYAGASVELNKIRERAGLAAITLTSANALSEIYDERQRELTFEGHESLDIYRTGRTLQRSKDHVGTLNNLKAGDEMIIFGIPQAEVDANPNMVQNPGF